MERTLTSPAISSSITRKRTAQKDKACASCQDISDPAKVAHSVFQKLGQSCSKARSKINDAAFGPIGYNGSCTYDCGFMEQTWSTGTWDYNGWAKNDILLPAVTVMDQCNAFSSLSSGITDWLNVRLPKYSSKILKGIENIQTIDEAIKNNNGVETPEQKLAIENAFSDMSQQVQNNLNEINNYLQQTSIFITKRKPNSGHLQSTVDSAKSSADKTITDAMNNLIGQLSCGAGDATNQYNAIKNTMNSAFDSLNTSFATVNTDFDNAIAAASVIPGVFIDIQTDSGSVIDSINKAKSYKPASALRILEMDILKDNWNNLVNYAQQNLAFN